MTAPPPPQPPLLQVGLRYSFVYHSQPEEYPGKGWSTPKFMPRAFDPILGTVVQFKWEDRPVGHVRILAADVAEDGMSVQFTYEITDLET